MSNFTHNSQSLGEQIQNLAGDIAGLNDDQLGKALQHAREEFNLRDFYTISLWGYCAGNKTNDGYEVDYCSKPKASFWFNPVEIWNLNETGVDELFPSNLNRALDIYETVSKWMFVAYTVAVIATIIELIVGLSAIFSRLGSLVTSLVSGVAALFTVAASVTAITLFAVLKGTFNNVLEEYRVHGDLGRNIYVATFIASAFALAGTLFWLISSCCCSGRSPYHGDRKRGLLGGEKTPYSYERVGSPYMGPGHTSPLPTYTPGSHVPMQTYNRSEAYEPYRQV